jgi:hypothetical protein
MSVIDGNPLLLSDRLRRLHGDVSASELARIYGVEVLFDAWRAADGRLIYFAECRSKPPIIILNTMAIEQAARSVPGDISEDQRHWFCQSQIAEVIIAHELYHILTQQPSSHEIESSAHEFAQNLTGIPFSPLIYESVLKDQLDIRHKG